MRICFYQEALLGRCFDAWCVVLFQINLEEYGEALELAQRFKLDTDLVYQRQWTKSPITVISIKDYLVSRIPFELHFIQTVINSNQISSPLMLRKVN